METKISLPNPDDQKKLSLLLQNEAITHKHIDQKISLPLTDEQKTTLSQIDSTDQKSQFISLKKC
jgi:hypothetical protein